MNREENYKVKKADIERLKKADIIFMPLGNSSGGFFIEKVSVFRRKVKVDLSLSRGEYISGWVKFKDYRDYYEYVVDYNIKCRENNNNPVKSGEYNYLFSFNPERRLLLDRHFEFIKNLNPITYNEKGKKENE